MSAVPRPNDFVPSTYWGGRLHERSPLEATGTRPFCARYQQYLYRLKEAAIMRVLRPVRARVRGASVLNVGCGWGYFEPFFARLGAAEVAGADFVASAIEQLKARRPEFEYHCADLTGELPESLRERRFDLVTALDVLYHIVDDAAFERALANLCTLCRPGGLFLWTDAPYRRNDPTQPHCRYRDLGAYRRVFERHGVEPMRSAPMYHLYDQYAWYSEGAARHPRVWYSLMYTFDRAMAPLGLRRSTNYCALGIRSKETS